MDGHDRRTRIAKLLAHVYLFQGLQPEDIKKIADRFITVKKDANQPVVSSSQPIRGLFIVDKGEVQLEIKRRLHKTESRLIGFAEFFNQESLSLKRHRIIPARTTQPSTLYLLKSEDYSWLIQEYPGVKTTLDAITASRSRSYAHPFPWLRAGEMVYFVSQKHYYFLIKSLILPIIFWLLSFPLISWGIASYASKPGLNATLILGGLLLIGTSIWGWWNYVDWGNDYYVVTNQEVTWLEKILLLYDSRNTAPLETILAVDISTPNVLARALKFGDVKARTFTGLINMRFVNQPDLMGSFIHGLSYRREYFLKEQDLEEIRQAVKDAYRKHRPGEETDSIPVIKPPPGLAPTRQEETQEKKDRWKKLSNMFKIRYEDRGVITYRKYWPVLIGKIWAPVLLLLFWFVAVIMILSGQMNSSLLCFSGTFLVLISFFLVSWLIYAFVDWRNDIYRLTLEQVIDLEKKPLGTENKKTADLKNILSIEHERIGFIGNLLNFGNVIINVGDTRITFQGVYDPDQIHYDVSGKLEDYKNREKRKKALEFRDQMINYLLAYYDATVDDEREHIVRTVYSMLKQRFPGVYMGRASVWQGYQPGAPTTPVSP